MSYLVKVELYTEEPGSILFHNSSHTKGQKGDKRINKGFKIFSFEHCAFFNLFVVFLHI